ncbi:FADL317Cp [Eremothecium gossypii FDAG1]|nr:FADL317Cp [Eremothecium gossypii FDAG1]
MNKLRLSSKRNRSLSTTNSPDVDENKHYDSLAKLQNDLSRIESSWNKVITKDANPLELALQFLDDTSVGLGHRYGEFHQLKSQIANNLQEAANEHYQTFANSIASYGQTVKYLNDSRGNISQVKGKVEGVMASLTVEDPELDELNNESMKHAKMIEILNAIEHVLLIPGRVEKFISERQFSSALESLVQGFTLAQNHHLWQISALSRTKQQLEAQENTLFDTALEELVELVYSKQKSVFSDLNFLDHVATEEGFNTLESHLHQVISIDIMEHSSKMNRQLQEFLKRLEARKAEGNSSVQLTVQNETDYDRIFSLLCVLNNMNKLSSALEQVVAKNKEELHLIVTKAVDNVRAKFPNILKMVDAIKDRSNFGISDSNFLSIVLRKLFWEIFTKFLMAAQGHRVIYEIRESMHTSSNSKYPAQKVWDEILAEIGNLLKSYTSDPTIYTSTHSRHRRSSAATSHLPQKKNLFNLQNNLVDSNATRNHANALKSLLQDMFPGFTSNSNLDLDEIYLEDDRFEEEDTLIPLSVFNMKVILESFLVFVEGTKNVIPAQFAEETVSSLVFFQEYMNNVFLPRLDRTINYFYEQQVEPNNPFALETINDSSVILKTAIDFRNLFIRLLYVMNTSYNYREGISDILLSLLHRFYTYYYNLFQNLLTSANSRFTKKLVATWLSDEELISITENILCDDDTYVPQETTALLKYCPDYDKKSGVVSKNDFFSSSTIDTITYFLGTLTWLREWLPQLKQEVNEDDYTVDVNNIDKLRSNWSFFEMVDLEKMDKMGSLKFLLTGRSLEKFNSIVKGFLELEYKLLSCLRYDVRAKCIYNITEMLHTSKWNPDATSIELNPYITALTSEIGLLENKLSQRSNDQQRQVVFVGLSYLINIGFLACSHSIRVLNTNGVKKIIRNVNVLQQTCRNISSTPEKEDMSLTLNYFAMCSMNENTVVEYYNEGKLSQYTLEEVKNILRLQFSEELYRKLRHKSGTRVVSISSNKRYEDAVNRLVTPT